MCPQPPLQMPHTKNAQVQVAKISRWRLQSLICIQQNQTEFKFQYGTDNWSKMRRDKEGNGAGGKVMEIKAPCERPLGSTQKLQIRLKNLQGWEQQENCLALLPFMLCGGKPPDFAWIKRLDYDKKYLLLPSAYPITATAQETPNFAHLHNPKEVMMCVCLIPCNMS